MISCLHQDIYSPNNQHHCNYRKDAKNHRENEHPCETKISRFTFSLWPELRIAPRRIQWPGCYYVLVNCSVSYLAHIYIVSRDLRATKLPKVPVQSAVYVSGLET